MGKFSVENDTKLLEIENYLANNQYLSGADKPDGEDGEIFRALHARKPEQPNWEKYPNTFAWFGWLNMFSSTFIEQLGSKPQTAAPQKSAPQKAAPAPAAAAADDDVDLFGDEETPEEKAKREAAAKAAKEKAVATKAAKPKPIAKTIILFNVKIFEVEQDLDKLADKIRKEVTQDGLIWYQNHRLVDVAYGIKMLELGCVVEDDKVATDDIIDKIQAWEDEVQSVDIASMQKV